MTAEDVVGMFYVSDLTISLDLGGADDGGIVGDASDLGTVTRLLLSTKR